MIDRGVTEKLLEGTTKYYGKELDAETLEIYNAFLRHVRFLMVNKVADQTEATHELLTHFGEHYRRQQQAESALRFEDITFLLSQSGTSDDDRTTFRLDASIDHLLLDEFQDTSLAQWRVLRPIAQRVATGRNSTFFCVGDTKQAIYGWRGGLAELFDAVTEELPGLEEVSLDTSYRSSQPVIDVVNQVFSRLDRHDNLDEYGNAVLAWQKRFNPHSTSKTELPGFVTLETCERLDYDPDDPNEDIREAAAEAFYDFAAAKIAEIYRRSPGMTIGVLTRTNDAVGKLIFRLRAADVPASEEGGNPLTDSAAVELLLSLIRLADHPSDDGGCVSRRPFAPGGRVRISSPDSFRRTAILADRLRSELMSEGYGRTIYRWAQVLAPSCDTRDRSRLQQLVELAYAWQPQSTLRPADFLRLRGAAKGLRSHGLGGAGDERPSGQRAGVRYRDSARTRFRPLVAGAAAGARVVARAGWQATSIACAATPTSTFRSCCRNRSRQMFRCLYRRPDERGAVRDVRRHDAGHSRPAPADPPRQREREATPQNLRRPAAGRPVRRELHRGRACSSSTARADWYELERKRRSP